MNPKNSQSEYFQDTDFDDEEEDGALSSRGIPLQSSEAHNPEEDDGSLVGGGENRDGLETEVHRALELSYTCMLIPRFPTHYLMGDLVGSLSAWMHQISVSFGWRIASINIKPKYLQWSIHVLPNDSPTFFMRTFRRQTSRRIFDEYPRFRRENISDDFWAPGYLIITGTLPHPPELVSQFVVYTRKQQGFGIEKT